LLDSGPCRFISGEEGHFILPRRLRGSQGQSGPFAEHRKHSPLPEFET